MPVLLTRRLVLAGCVASGALRLDSAEPKPQFPSDLSHRLSVSTYPFRSVIGSKMPLQSFAAGIVRDFGVYGIEPWSKHFDSLQPEYLRSLRDAFRAAGLQVVNIPCDVKVNPCGTEADAKAAQQTWRQWVEAARFLGAPSIRVHVPVDMGCAVGCLKSIAEYGESRGIVVNLENDDPKSEDPYRVLKVIETVASPYLRALPDFCNSMQIRNDERENQKALAALFPKAFNISHVKDIEVVGGKTLKVDVQPIFEIAKRAGYRGYFSMETEGSQDPYAGTRQLIAAARIGLA